MIWVEATVGFTRSLIDGAELGEDRIARGGDLGIRGRAQNEEAELALDDLRSSPRPNSPSVPGRSA